MLARMNVTEKSAIEAFWNAASCGEVYAVGEDLRRQLEAHATARYDLEPYIDAFAGFSDGKDRDVLEIGVGMGADHLKWAESVPRRLIGLDLTPRAAEFTKARLHIFGYAPRVVVGDAEELPFPDQSFDFVYSYGCLHHTPDTPSAVSEVLRVLRHGGECRVMVYHSVSPVGWLLWLRYAFMRGRMRTSLAHIYATYLESPGTQAFSRADARALFRDFRDVKLEVKLSFGDLLLGEAGQRHRGTLLRIAKRLWPRWLLRLFDGRIGLALLVRAAK